MGRIMIQRLKHRCVPRHVSSKGKETWVLLDAEQRDQQRHYSHSLLDPSTDHERLRTPADTQAAGLWTGPGRGTTS